MNVIGSAGDSGVKDMESVKGKSMQETALLLQYDWFRCVREDPFKFFVGIREPGQKSEFYDAVVENDLIDIQKCKRNMKAEMTGRTLQVSVDSELTTLFIAPTLEYGGIHNCSVVTVDVSDSGSMILSTGSDGRLKISSTTDGRLLRELEGHYLDLSAARFFPSGLVVLSGGMDLRVRVWSVETAQTAREMQGHKMTITDVAIIGSGKDVVSCSKDGTAKKWNCGRGECDITWSPEAGECTSIDVSKDQTMVGIGCALNKAFVYDIKSETKISSIVSSSGVSSLSFSPSGTLIVCGQEDGGIGVYDNITGTCQGQISTDRGRVEKIVWRNDGVYAAFHDGTVCVYDPPLKFPCAKIEFSGGDCDPIYDFAFHNDTLYTACRDKTIRAYKLSL